MKGIRFWSPQFYLLGLAICLSSWYSCDPVDYQNASSLVFSSSTIHSNHSNLSLPYSSSLIPWSDFWQLSLSHFFCNVWYQHLHKKNPLPVTPLESTDHFVFTCSLKFPILQHTWTKYINPSSSGISVNILRVTMYTLQTFLPIKTSSLLPIIATLESIWLSHWLLLSTIFHQVIALLYFR